MTNPLLENNALPAFGRIEAAHFEPALDVMIDNAYEKLERLKRSADEPTFANSVAILDSLFEDIDYVQNIFQTYAYSLASDDITALWDVMDAKADKFSKAVYQDRVIAARFKAIYDQRDQLGLDEEEKRLLAVYHFQFENNGAFLETAAEQEALLAIDNEMIGLASTFRKNHDDSARAQAVLFTDPADLAGLEPGLIETMAENARGAGHEKGWLLIPERLQIDGLLCCAESRHFRQAIFEALERVGVADPHNNEEVIRQLHTLRQKRAQILGYRNYTESVVAETMAGTSQTIDAMLRDAQDQLMPLFEDQVREIKAYAAARGAPAVMEPWDLSFWAAQRERDAAKDVEDSAPYYEFGTAMQSLFTELEEKFGVSFAESNDYPLYHDDVKTYEVRDVATGDLRAVLYADFYQREQKSSGAWMGVIQSHSEKDGVVRPAIASLNANGMKPVARQIAFIPPGDYDTIRHEAGHDMHLIMGAFGRFHATKGCAGSTDFFEIHSTMMEFGSIDPDALQKYMRHYQTGAPMSRPLAETMAQSKKFEMLRWALMYAQNALRDLAFHRTGTADYVDAATIERDSLMDSPSVHLLRPYGLRRLLHTMDSGNGSYVSRFFGYTLARIGAATGYVSLRDNPQASELMTAFYSAGGSVEPNALYQKMTGGPAQTRDLARLLTPAPRP